ncbi:MAG: AMP-binding protein [Cytophagaceae bacterium]
MNIVNLFLDAALKFPDSIALVEGNRRISYAELEREVKLAAAGLLKKGIKKGDRVLIFVPMSINLYKTVLAVFHIGATAVFLDEWVNKKRLEQCCKMAECRAMIGVWKARLLALFSSELRKIRIVLSASVSGDSVLPPVAVETDDIALLTFTTGSTGVPKAAARTHGFLYEQFKALSDTIDPSSSETDLSNLPIVLLSNLGTGGTSVIADFKSSKPWKMDPERMIRSIKENKVSRITASPYFLLKISDYVIENKIELGLQKVFTGGAPVFPEEAQKLMTSFPKARIKIVYGSTEAEPVSSVYAEDLVSSVADKGLYVGKLYDKIRVEVIPITEGPITINNEKDLIGIFLAPGKIGEIIVSGKHVLKQYFRNEEAQKLNKIVTEADVWHRTGDAGYLDHEGKLYLCGRAKHMIKEDDQWHAPFIWENKLKKIPGVIKGTIVKMDGEILLIIMKDRGVREEIVKNKLQEIGISYNVKFVLEIPMDPRHYSKIDYDGLIRFLLVNTKAKQ